MNRELCIMACVFCRDRSFQRYLMELSGAERIGEVGAKDYILTVCEIKSRNELDTNPEAAKRFHDQIRTPYMEWKEQP